MRLKINKLNKRLLAIAGVLFLGFVQIFSMGVSVHGLGITMSPPNQKIVLNAGEKFTGDFVISNGTENATDLKYVVETKPFYVDENYNIYYSETDGFNQIVDWITTSRSGGILPANGTERINFTIDVPEDAPAGGQYAAIVVTSVPEESNDEYDGSTSARLNENIGMAHIIYAEIAGTTRHSGEVVNVSLPNFIFDGNIAAESTIKNTGNTHGTVTYKMQVFPLFSDEEVFTNEEDPQTKTILPNRALLNKTIWEQTPAMGIFNVKYTIEFEGVTTEVNKLVIKCPIWLLFIILFVIILFVIWIFTRTKSKKSSKKAEN